MEGGKQNIQFFQSESSFGSESNISDSRYYDFNNQIITQTQNVFTTLRKQLQPIQAQNNNQKIQYALRRAIILHNNTIPQQVNYLRKVGSPENAYQSISNCHQRLNKLLKDQDKLAKNQISYKQYYNNYGKNSGSKDLGFSKKKQPLELDYEQTVIRPEYIQIAYSHEKPKLRGSTPRLFMGSQSNNDKQVLSLKEEIYQLKKSLDQNKKNHEEELTNQKINAEKRMRVYLMNQSKGQVQKSLKLELAQKSQQLIKALNENKRLQSNIDQQNKTLQIMKSDILSLKEQIQILRKTDNNILEYQQIHNKSYNSQTNQVTDKKIQKQLKNALVENQILKNQLKSERQRLYKLKNDQNQQQKRQLQRTRKTLKSKQSELEQLYAKFDEQRIEIMHLTALNQSNGKFSQTLKRQNDLLKNKMENKVSNISPNKSTTTNYNQANFTASRRNTNKIQIFDYEGDGIQGFPYYENLSKEFKIRFKRGCLRDKQLLYKVNGVQIGTISSFQNPNKIGLLVHITNYSQSLFSNLRAKFMNPHQNKIQGQLYNQETIKPNQQIKIPVSLSINQYPIGPLILLLEYQVLQKKEEIRILLPVHIFKTMQIEQRTQQLRNGTIINIIPQRKIVKELSDIRSYFKLPKDNNKQIRISLFNQHTHTILFLDIATTKDGIKFTYEHKEGNNKITQYFIKTFGFLLSK